jgi:tRNA pseudouridine55 synthase
VIDGLVVVDKPAGWTSHDVVARCRRVFGQQRVGHSGTLDPGATGVLLVGLGRASRLLRFLTALDKSYTAEVVLGVATSSLDADGAVVGEWDMSEVSLEALRDAAKRLTGDILQVPPMVSAVKVEGRRLHQLARAGVEVDREPRAVTVHRFEVLGWTGTGVARVEVGCSSGTYVRSLAADVGAALGGGAHLRNLRRTAIGSFRVGEALPLDELGPAAVLEPVEAMRDYAQARVQDPGTARAVGHGQVLDKDALGALGAGPWAVLDADGQLLAVYEAVGEDRARPAVVVAPASRGRDGQGSEL